MTKRKYVVFSNDVAPVHPGVYQREFLNFKTGKPTWKYAVWRNGAWYCSWNSIAGAKSDMYKSIYQTGDISDFSLLRWRGLAEKPE